MMRSVLVIIFVSLLSIVQTPNSVWAQAPFVIEEGKRNASELEFKQEGDDLVVSLMIEGPAVNQAVLTNFTIDDGRPSIEEIILGAPDPPPEKRKPPHVLLHYCVFVNNDLPGFNDGGLLNVPTPPEERRRQRQKVVWRLSNFRKGQAVFTARGIRLYTSTEQLRKAIPQFKKLIEAHEKRLRDAKERRGPPP